MIFLAGYGMYAPCGHMDFFPNGGRVQPGCDQSLFQYIGDDGLYDGNANCSSQVRDISALVQIRLYIRCDKGFKGSSARYIGPLNRLNFLSTFFESILPLEN